MKIGLTFNLKGERQKAEGRRQKGEIQNSKSKIENSPLRDDYEEEFDSPETVDSIRAALESLGHEVELLGYGREVIQRLLDGPPVDLVFNFAEGLGSGRCREALLPATLEMLGVPYTGSDPLTLAATLDKDVAKRLVSAAGVKTPRGVLVGNDECRMMNDERKLHSVQNPKSKIRNTEVEELALPVIVKPAYEGSSKGVLESSLVLRPEDLWPTIERMVEDYGQAALVEEFIDGDELTVGVVGNDPPEVLGIMRVVPRNAEGPFIYSLEVKRDWRRRVRYESPAPLAPETEARVKAAAIACWKALGCRDVSRFDFRLRDGEPYFLECNPLPGLSPEHGDLVLLSRGVGVEYEELIARIVQAAADRAGIADTPELAHGGRAR